MSIDFSDKNWKKKYIEENDLYCSECGSPFDYNPYQDFWFESCQCHNGDIFDVIKDIQEANQI